MRRAGVRNIRGIESHGGRAKRFAADVLRAASPLQFLLLILDLLHLGLGIFFKHLFVVLEVVEVVEHFL